MALTIADLQARLRFDTSEFRRGTQTVQGGLRRLSRGFAGLRRAVFSLTAALGVAGLTGILVKSVRDFAAFEKSILEVAALMDNVTKNQIRGMQRAVLEVSRQFGQTSASASKALFDITSSGIQGREAMVLLQESSKLALAGFTNLNTATNVLISGIQSYSLTVEDAQRVSDALFSTARFGRTTFGELAQSIGRVLPFAKAANLSLEQLGSALATITLGGLETQEATLALRNALAQLVTLGDPTELQRQALEDLGITVRRTEEGMVDVLDVIRQLQGANLEQVLGLIPSVRAAAGILSLANNWERFGEILGEFAGTAGIVDQVSQDLAESTQVKLNQAVETVRQTFIKFGEALVEGGIVSRGVAFLQSGMEGFIRLIEENKEGIASFVELLITGVGAAGRIAADIAGGAGQALTEDVNKFVRGLSSERLRAIQQATAAANRERLLQDIGEFPFGGGRVRQESPLTTRFPVAELQAAAISELQRRDVLQELEERKEAIAEVNREFAELAKFARERFPPALPEEEITALDTSLLELSTTLEQQAAGAKESSEAMFELARQAGVSEAEIKSFKSTVDESIDPFVLEQFASATKGISPEIQRLAAQVASAGSRFNLSFEQMIDLARRAGVSIDRDFIEVLRTKLPTATEKSLQAQIEMLAQARRAWEEVFGAIRRGIAESVTGVLRGTQTMEEAFRNMARNIALSLLEQIVNRALRQIQEAIIDTILTSQQASQANRGGGGIVGTLSTLVGSLFGGGGGAASVFTAPPSPFSGSTVAFTQAGGIVRRPTLLVAGEGGEPEVVSPLSRLPEIAAQVGVGPGRTTVQQVFNVSPGLPETVRREVFAMLPLIERAAIDAVIQARNRGGSMARAMGERA